MTLDKLMLILFIPGFFISGLIGCAFLWFDPSQTLFTRIITTIIVIGLAIVCFYNLRAEYEALVYPNEYRVRVWDGVGWYHATIRGKSYDHAVKRYKKLKHIGDYSYVELIREL